MHITLTPHIRACADKAITGSLGKPWAPLGRGPNSFDCWGFVVHVYKAAGIVLPTTPMPDPCYDINAVATESGLGAERVPPRTPYSIVLMGKAGVFGHVGVYHPSGVIYHCLDHQGVAGHSVQTLQSIFADIQYWSVTNDLRCIPS